MLLSLFSRCARYDMKIIGLPIRRWLIERCIPTHAPLFPISPHHHSNIFSNLAPTPPHNSHNLKHIIVALIKNLHTAPPPTPTSSRISPISSQSWELPQSFHRSPISQQPLHNCDAGEHTIDCRVLLHVNFKSLDVEPCREIGTGAHFRSEHRSELLKRFTK